jgi:5-methyltetrahydrofolate--homocysteine methyltransferase
LEGPFKFIGGKVTFLTSPEGSLEFGKGCPTLLINDHLRVMDQDENILTELARGNITPLIQIAKMGRKQGLPAVDILMAHPDLDEVSLLPKITKAVIEEVGCFILLDSRDPQALEAALIEMRPYKAMINSVNADPEVMEALLPLVAKYDAAVVVIPLGAGKRVPETAAERVTEAKIIIESAKRYDIPLDNLVIDAICLASSVEPGTMEATLQTLAAIEEMGLTTILGIGNAGHGMPTQTYIDLAYLLAAIPWGLHSALVNPITPYLVETTLAVDFLLDRDPYGKRYINRYRESKKDL